MTVSNPAAADLDVLLRAARLEASLKQILVRRTILRARPLTVWDRLLTEMSDSDPVTAVVGVEPLVPFYLPDAFVQPRHPAARHVGVQLRALNDCRDSDVPHVMALATAAAAHLGLPLLVYGHPEGTVQPAGCRTTAALAGGNLLEYELSALTQCHVMFAPNSGWFDLMCWLRVPTMLERQPDVSAIGLAGMRGFHPRLALHDPEGSVANCVAVRRDGLHAGKRVMSDFTGRHFEGEIVLWAVRWYCRYGVSYRDLEQMMGERGVAVDHSTIYRWVQRYAPEIEKRLRWQWRGPRSTSWRVDETYVKVRGQWTYLYRAVDKLGNTIDFYLSPTRNTAAAKRFLGKALHGLKDWEKPTVINTDKAPTYAAALAELKQEGRCPKETRHRQVKYLNNVIEADHGKLKQLIRPVRGFKTLKTAYATIKGFEVMRALRKGQASAFNLTRDIRGEARIVERAFGLGASALAEAAQFLNERLRVETA